MERRSSEHDAGRREAGRNPVQVALDNYTDMEDRLAAAEKECSELRDMNRGLIQENQLLKGNYKELRGHFARLQAYSVNLTTRLTIIQEVVGQAMNESAKIAARGQPTDIVEDPLADLTALVKSDGDGT